MTTNPIPEAAGAVLAAGVSDAQREEWKAWRVLTAALDRRGIRLNDDDELAELLRSWGRARGVLAGADPDHEALR